MSREWEPGDVLLDTDDGMIGLVVDQGFGCRSGPQHDDAGTHVHYEDGDWNASIRSDHRRLLVIDPEDREQIERLESAMADALGWTLLHNGPRVDGLQAALRSLLAPPKPDEPTGLGAVVEDTAGERWVRFCDSWRLDQSPAGYRSYSAIDVVRVLSVGVTA